ncbi:excinuclease ABC subunit UvrC [Salmonella enterica]|nr:excinuclease ABC subunit UvrC [Salmonella enterica]
MQENDFFTWRRAMLLRFQEMAAAEDVYTELQYQTQRLEFDYYALCVRHPVPFTRPKISLRTTYPPAWVTHYQSENYFAIDPVLKPENFRQGHLHWDDVLFHEAQAMWDAAQRFGLRRGVTQCVMLPNRALGSRSYFPKVPGGTELGEVVETFVGQFYLQGSQMRTLPGEILLDFNLSDKTLLADSLSELAGRRIHVQTKPRGDRARYLKLARTNAATALITKLSQQSTITQRLTALAAVLKLPAIKRMECFDISHTMGEQTVASCVVFDANGPLRAEYRRYNIAGITPGDDYAAMNQVLRRRYGKAIEESKIPDVILIDGGKGQLAQAKAVFAELDVPWDKHRPLLLGVAKGADRKAGLEILFFEPEGEGFSLPPDSPALHVIQHIRDESHDHAIGGHRKKRAKVKNTSTLETIEGVGPKRRQMLLKYMGGLQGLRNASVEEIAKVPGISQGLAEKIFWSLKH